MALQNALVGGLIAFTLLFCGIGEQAKAVQPALPSLPGSNASGGSAMPTWDLLTKENVEAACLDQAKSYAEGKGYPPAAVFSCGCSEQASDNTKTFDCSINALDGKHAVVGVCLKTRQECTITSEYGDRTLTFDQLRQYT